MTTSCRCRSAKNGQAGAPIGGQRLSSGASRSERVTALVYLDAAYSFALNDGSIKGTEAVLDELHKDLQGLQTRAAAHDRRDSRDLVRQLVKRDLHAAKTELSRFLSNLEASAQMPKPIQPTAEDVASFRAFQAFSTSPTDSPHRKPNCGRGMRRMLMAGLANNEYPLHTLPQASRSTLTFAYQRSRYFQFRTHQILPPLPVIQPFAQQLKPCLRLTPKSQRSVRGHSSEACQDRA